MEIYGLGIARNTIAIVGKGKVITWNLPAENHVLNDRANINDSIWTTPFDFQTSEIMNALISPNLNYIAAIVSCGGLPHLDIYEVSTGKHLGGSGEELMCVWWFTPDGLGVLASSSSDRGGPCHFWDPSRSGVRKWAITKDSESGMMKVKQSHQSGNPPGGFPWQSSHGHQVMDNGWVLSPGGKQLLWLPPHLQLDKTNRVWSGYFLAFLHCTLPEVVILELPEE